MSGAVVRKVLILLLEGPSDMTALGGPLVDLLDTQGIECIPIVNRGDITTKAKISGVEIEPDYNNINTVVEDVVQVEMEPLFANEYSWVRGEDILGVVQIADTDGAFSRDDARKRNNLIMLTKEGCKVEIKGKKIPYRIFYMAKNLEHVLYGEKEIDGSKTKRASEFARKCYGEEGFFEKVLCYPEINPKISNQKLANDTRARYKESWAEIQEGINSSGRKTNLNILIDDLCRETSKKELY